MRRTAGESKIQNTFTKPTTDFATYKALEWQPTGLKSTIERFRRRILLHMCGHQQASKPPLLLRFDKLLRQFDRRMPMTYVSFLRHVDALLSGISLQQQILPAGIPIAHSNKALHVDLSSRSSRDLCELDLSLPQIDRKAHFLQSILQGRPLLASEFLVARQNFTKS